MSVAQVNVEFDTPIRYLNRELEVEQTKKRNTDDVARKKNY